MGTATLGSFDAWAKTMDGVLNVAGIPGFLINAQDFYNASDIESEFWRALVDAWWEVYGSTDVTANELFRLPIVDDSPLFDATSREKAKQSFGLKLRQQQDHQYGDKRIDKGDLNRDKVRTYRLVDRTGATRPRQDRDARNPFGRPGDVIDLDSIRTGRA
jgi:hypothetical protein